MPEQRPPVCDYEGSDYQESFWDQADRAYEDRVEAIALRRMLPRGGRRLLELGAGAGRNTSRYQGFDQIVLLDYSRTQLEQALGRLGESERYIYVVGDVYRLPFKIGAFDGATMIRTLHHMVKPEQVLVNVYESLTAGATLILEFANKHNLKAILRWLLRRQAWNPFDLQQVEIAHLNFNFHPAAVRASARKAGYQVRQVLTVSHFRVGILKKLVPLPLLVAADSLLQWTGRLWQLSPSVFMRLVVPGEQGAHVTTEIFRCPVCHHEDLSTHEKGLQCAGCGRVWGYREGIYNFKEPLESDDERQNIM